ncbi:LuxR C-terminal-related transcriptional regulator [uncultured Sphingosinicella sp.]|uniref:helix-turn-helix transcriptional regulator n=1 Tax=uncultured Sphingosinicella sp. TaxID=478748 RepID=UPI0030DB278D|tara:strand:- start:3702 stop:6368 length:2667 start_codon:yes stop_codon:yes gene_type:complete
MTIHGAFGTNRRPGGMKFLPLGTASDAVERMRLIELALRGAPAAAGSTIITAPAGYGKTTLLVQIRDELQPLGFHSAWLNCTADHVQPAAFLVDLAASFQRAGMFPSMSEFGLSDIVSSISGCGPVSIFIDEYECASSDETDNFLELFIRMLPPNCKLFVATRELPKISLSKLLVDARTRLLKANELQFNPEETRLLMADTGDMDQYGGLLEQCDGWPVILQLLRLEGQSLQKTGIPPIAGQHRASIFNYIAEQVLARQEQELQEFLLQISILWDVDVASACAVTQNETSERVLRAALNLSPIVTPLSEAPLSLRLHPLFRDFLRQELAVRMPSAPNALHERAAVHFAAAHDLQRAVHHASLSGQNDLTVKILEDAGGTLLVISEGIAAAGAFLATLPANVVTARPKLRQLRVIQQAMEGTSADWLGDFERLDCLCGATHAAFADDTYVFITDLIRAIRNCSETRYAVLSAPWAELAKLREKCLALRYEEPRYLGICLPAEQILLCDYGSVSLAERRTQELQALFETEHYAPNTVWITNHLSFIAVTKGQSRDAEHYSRVVLERLADAGEMRNTFMRRHCTAILGQSFFEQNMVDVALAHFDAVPRQIAYSLLSTQVYAICTRARCLVLAGEIDQALSDLDDDYQYALEEALPHMSVIAPAVGAELRLAAGDMSGCEQLIRSAKLDALLDQHRTWFVRPWLETESLVRLFSRYWLRTDEADRAYNLAHEFAVRASQSGRLLMGAGGFLDAAAAALAAGHRGRADAAIGQAVKQVEGSGAVRLFLDAHEDVQALLQEKLQNERGHEILSLLSARVAQDVDRGGLAKLLSPREQEVMAELCLGHPTKLAARHLNLSYETVRHHLKRIYTKLHVHTRQQAVEAWKRQADTP